MSSDVDVLMALWEDGQRRIDQASALARPALERVASEIVVDLHRRLGGRFTTVELAAYYLDAGTDWCFQIAMDTAPGSPEAWDVATVAGAAFARYARAAADWGGGVRHVEEE